MTNIYERGVISVKYDSSSEDLFLGAVTVGERGQVVIPAEARKRYGMHPGDRMLVMGHPSGEGVLLVKIEAARGFIDAFMRGLSRAEEILQNDSADE